MSFMTRLCLALSCTMLGLPLPTSAVAAPRWALQPTAIPAHTAHGELDGVSCTSRFSCVAVGSFHNTADHDVALVERWKGRFWSLERIPRPRKSTDDRLIAVSCATARSCMAVGSFDTKAGDTVPLAIHWNGTRWAITGAHQTAGGEVTLIGVSCPSTRACSAVGSSGSDPQEPPAAELWNGSRWLVQRTQKPPGRDGADLLSVSCTSNGSCAAVGQLFNSDTECWMPLVEQWSGSGWSIVGSPKVGVCSSDSNGLDGVSCVSTNACAAVGYNDAPEPVFATGAPLIERWAGTSWSIEPGPDITYRLDPWGGGGFLDGVSCTSPTACTAVGALSSQIITRPLVESWDGTAWRIGVTPGVPRDGGLIDVSCIAGGGCAAVGFNDSTGSDLPLAESTFGGAPR
jgi:hypothetical protein